MGNPLSQDALETLFLDARTYNGWLERPVSDETLHQLYDLLKWGPTSANCCPLRIVFLRSKQAKERLRPALSLGNVDKTMSAPATAILAYDLRFYEYLPRLFTHNPAMAKLFAENGELAETTARRNATLQGAYFIMAARSLGLDCGPMSGFDNDKVDQEFFGAGKPQEGLYQEYFPGRYRSDFLCNIGYGDPASLYPRAARLEFDEVCQRL